MRMISKRAEFMNLKKPDYLRKYAAESVQDTIEVQRVSNDGLFQINEDLWSKTYEISDINYSLGLYEEQLMFFADYSQSLNSFDFPFKITIFNKNRNINEMEQKILYKSKDDGLDEQRDAFNEVINSGIIGGNHGIEQKKYLTVSFKQKRYEDAISYAETIDNTVTKEFENLGSSLTALSGNERIETLYNFYRMGSEDKFNIDITDCILKGRDWKNDVVCSYLDFGSDRGSFRMGNKWGNKYCQALYISPNSYPSDIDDELIYDISNIKIPSLVTVDYVPIRKDYVNTMLEAKQNGIETDISRQQEARNKAHNFLSDISYNTRKNKENLENMRDDIKKNDQKTYWIGITVILVADTKRQLQNAYESVKQVAEKRSLRIGIYGADKQRDALATALPVGGRYVSEMRTLFSRNAASFMPFHVMDLIDLSEQSFYYGKNKRSKNPIIANRKKLVNSSGFVIGIPGSGKSFTGSKMEMGSVVLKTEDDVIIVDPTLEYRNVVETYNGSYVNIDPNTNDHINPLDVPLSVFDNVGILDKTIREKYTLMRGICAQAMGAEFNARHSSVVDSAVRTLFREISKMPKDKRFVPIMSDFIDVVKFKTPDYKMEYANDIIVCLEVFVDGALNVFNHQTNVDVSNRVLAYGIRDMDEELSQVAMLIILESIKDRVKKNQLRGKATWLYIDEFHMLLDSKYTRDFVVKFWKVVRKMGCIPTGITQNISMLLSDDKLTTLVSNSEYTVIMKQSTKDARSVVDFFEDISASQIRELSKAHPGTGIIRFGNAVIPLDNQMDKTNPLYNIFNTNLHEKAQMKNAMKKKRRKIVLAAG